MPWLRRIYRRGSGVMVTIPAAVRKTHAWNRASHVDIRWEPPVLILTPVHVEELMARARQEGEDLEDDAGTNAQS